VPAGVAVGGYPSRHCPRFLNDSVCFKVRSCTVTTKEGTRRGCCRFSNLMSCSQLECHLDVINDKNLRISSGHADLRSAVLRRGYSTDADVSPVHVEADRQAVTHPSRRQAHDARPCRGCITASVPLGRDTTVFESARGRTSERPWRDAVGLLIGRLTVRFVRSAAPLPSLHCHIIRIVGTS
jgi:hypothetical protein